MASHLFLFLTLFLLLSHQIHSISFQIKNFKSNSNMVYNGDAKPTNDSIRFNGKLGWATYSQNLLLCDHTYFKTHFSFLIKNNNNNKSTLHTNELGFFLAPSIFNPPLNSSPSFVDLFNSTQNQIFHVQFDLNPPFQHIGINNNSIASSIYYSPWNPTNHDHNKKTLVWISYNSTSKNLSITFKNNNNNTTTLSLQINLMKILPEKVTVGFSATLVDDLRIELWEFNSSNLDGNYASDEKAIDMNLLAVLIAWVGVFVIAIISILIISLMRKKKKKDDEEHGGVMKLASIYSDLNKEEGSPQPRRFSYTYLAMATNNFAKNRKLGEGGFGEVFEAHLPGANKTVAIKKIFKTGSIQGKREYVNEVKIINGAKHKNLVQLIGWCHENDNSEFLLVYEFVPNGTLHSHLFGNRPPLPWSIRYKISLGLASALLYLQEEREHSVVHRDIKSSNLLLDLDFTAKLGDFGLARLTKHELNSRSPPGLVGTFGYMAPEYISSGRASKESDIFSYGVVLLEIVSGRKCCDNSGKGLIEFVWDAYGRGEVFEAILDEKLGDEFVEAKEVECLSVVGLWCAHPDATQRPSIKQVIQVLNFQEEVPKLPLKMPLPIFNHASFKVNKLNVVYPEANLSLTCTPLRI